ncbi:MAG: hypothetical protein IH944_12295 [Armatimonadetes bacterium]|nr:hypothetical protein [Armatimonadota bacterium]
MKKRKAWWIAGAVGFFALLYGTISLIGANTPDARLAATLEEVFEEYGFDQFEPRWGSSTVLSERIVAYRSPLLYDREIDEIAARIRDEFGSSIEWPSIGESSQDIYKDGSRVHYFYLDSSHFEVRAVAVAQEYGHYIELSDPGPWSVIIVWRNRPPSPLDRIRRVWPW